MVGLIPLFAVETIEPELLKELPSSPGVSNGSSTPGPISQSLSRAGTNAAIASAICSLLRGHRMKCLLKRMLDETEFLSDYGVRHLAASSGASLRVPFQRRHDERRLLAGGIP